MSNENKIIDRSLLENALYFLEIIGGFKTVRKKYLLMENKQRTANSTYKKLADEWLNEALYFVSSSVQADSFRHRNRQLLAAAANKHWSLQNVRVHPFLLLKSYDNFINTN